MRPKEYDLDVADASLTGFASNVTGATFTITTTTTSDGLAHQVSVRNDSATDHSAKTLTLVGTDADGHAQTETMSAPAGSATVESTKYYKTLTSVTPSATINADTFDIGWVDEVASKTVPLNWRNQAGAAIHVDVTGTLDFTVQETFDSIQDAGDKAQQDAHWMAIAALTAKTADTVGVSTPGATAIRLLFNSYSTGAELQMHVSQPVNT